jgi:hypothetical protein
MIGWLPAQKRTIPTGLSAAGKSLAVWRKKLHWMPSGVMGKYAG